MEKPILSVPVIISKKGGYPIIELRKATSNEEVMKKILSCAFHETPIIIMPQFTDKMQSISSMLEKGIIYKNEEGGYNFTF